MFRRQVTLNFRSESTVSKNTSAWILIKTFGCPQVKAITNTDQPVKNELEPAKLAHHKEERKSHNQLQEHKC